MFKWLAKKLVPILLERLLPLILDEIGKWLDAGITNGELSIYKRRDLS